MKRKQSSHGSPPFFGKGGAHLIEDQAQSPPPDQVVADRKSKATCGA